MSGGSEVNGKRAKITLKDLSKPTTISGATLYSGVGPFGSYYMIGNDDVVVFVNERTYAYEQLKQVEAQIRDAVFDIEFAPGLTRNGRKFVEITKIQIIGKRARKVVSPQVKGGGSA
jgi:hypothetical protein